MMKTLIVLLIGIVIGVYFGYHSGERKGIDTSLNVFHELLEEASSDTTKVTKVVIQKRDTVVYYLSRKTILKRRISARKKHKNTV